MEPLELSDSFSVRGVESPAKIMAVSRNGQLLFKKSSRQLYYYDVHDHCSITLDIVRIDPLYADCQVYDIALLQEGRILLCLQRREDFFICVGQINVAEGKVCVEGNVYRTKIVAQPGRNVILTSDEDGIVLMSHPIKWQDGGTNQLELFHVSNFLKANAGDKYVISLQHKGGKLDATFDAPFISRNYLYLFYAQDFSKFLIVPLSGSTCGRCEPRQTQGVPPNNLYLSKTVEVFSDFALVYASMHSQQKAPPNVYMLNLTNLRWYPSVLSLSSHTPNGKISFRKGCENVIYLHGDCNLHGCREKAHLYQINIENCASIVLPRRRTQSVGALFASLSATDGGRSKMIERSSTISSQGETSPRPLLEECTKGRFKKNRSDLAGRKWATSDRFSYSASAIGESTLKKVPSWSADMAETAENSLHEQLCIAKDLGYSQQVIFQALRRNQTNAEQPFKRFDSTNSMLDILQEVSNSPSNSRSEYKLSLLNTDARKSNEPLQKTPNRSVSFTGDHRRRSEKTDIVNRKTDDLKNLLKVLESERKAEKVEQEEQIKELRDRIHHLELLNEKISDDKSSLRRKNDNLDKALKTSNEQVEQLEKESMEKSVQIDSLTKESSQKLKDINNEMKTTINMLKLTENQLDEKNKQVDELKEEVRILKETLEQREAVLDEQSARLLLLEERNKNLQSERLFANLSSETELMNKKMDEIIRSYERIKEQYGHVINHIPEKEKMNQQLARQLADRDEAITLLKLERRQFQDKTTIECCICLNNRPDVLFQPCLHLVVCNECFSGEQKIKDCPTCRIPIKEYLTIYH